MLTRSQYPNRSLQAISSLFIALAALSYTLQSSISQSILLSVIENIVALESQLLRQKPAVEISLILTITYSLSLSITLGVGERASRLCEGTKQSIRTCYIFRKALQVSVSYVFLPCSFRNYASFLSFLVGAAIAASLFIKEGVVVLFYFIKIRDILASSQSYYLKIIYLLFCYLFLL